MKKAIKDIKIGDKVLGTDGKWHNVIGKTDIKVATNMYKVTFDNGYVKCSDTHQWNIFINNKEYTIDAEGLYQEFDFYKGNPVGTADGHILVNIEKIPEELVQCITTDAPDQQFAIYVTKEEET